MFRVEIENGRRVLAHVADRLAMHYARLVAGDEVEVELAERDRSRGRIRKRL
ncbi:MAG: translation initiation factor IF-1 [Candidatus Dormibacteraeota bacterium]|jgi:translation initiation factor IF-1|nr:translation initiation factor IF-1 [Candidatus Dormibacteraeota bacterium]